MVYVAAGVIAVLAAAVVWWRNRPSSIFGERQLRVVLVTLDTNEAFRGVLFKVDTHAVVLRSAMQVDPTPDGGNVAVDGEIVLPRTRIAYYQFP